MSIPKEHSAIHYIDLSQVNEHLRGFSGCLKVGQDILFAPLMNGPGTAHGLVTRWIQGESNRIDYCDVSLWFDGASGFVGILSDGRYVYLVPYHNTKHHGTLVRYDSFGDFHGRSYWDAVDLQQLVHPEAKGFVSGSFDGRFIYLAPYQSDWTTHHGHVLRYDTQASFSSADSWSHFDAPQLHPQARGFHSSVSTPNHTLFIPYVLENRLYHGHLIRLQHNHPAGFESVDSWEHFDLSSIHPDAKGYVGACQDGCYIYFAPYYNGKERHGLVLQYEYDKELSDPSSWKFFDLTHIHKDLRGFFGAVHHKEYIYFLPHCKEEGIYHGTLVRYNRKMPFDSIQAWSILDTTEYHPQSKGFIGSCISGDTMILSPYETTTHGHSGLVCTIELDHAPFQILSSPIKDAL